MSSQTRTAARPMTVAAEATRDLLDQVSIGQALSTGLRWGEYSFFVLVCWATAGAFHGLILKTMGGAPFLGVFSFAPQIGAVLAIVLRPQRTFKGLAATWPILPYAGLSAASVLWSANPDDTWRAVIEAMCALIFVGYATRRFGWRLTMDLIFAAFVSMVAVSILLGLAAPGVGATSAVHPGAWSGLFIEKNKFGGVCVIAFAAVCAHFMLSQQRVLMHAGCALLCVLGLLLSESKTALLSFIVTGGAFGFMLVVRRGPVSGLLGSYLGVIVVGVASFVVATNAEALLELLGRSGNLSSRADIWRSMGELAASKPWGYGYNAFWSDQGLAADVAWIEKWLSFRPSHGHNSWLDARLELGVLGPVALGILVGVTLLAGGLRGRGDQRVYWAVPLIAYLMVTSMSETIINGPANIEYLLLMLTAALVAPLPRGGRDWDPDAQALSAEASRWSGGGYPAGNAARAAARSAAARGWPHPRPAPSRYPKTQRPGRGPSRR